MEKKIEKLTNSLTFEFPETRNNQQVEIPLFRTEEGRYLATSLGDPLIKGLTEVANLRPQDPIQFLANYLQNFSPNDVKPKIDDTKLLKNEKINEAAPVIENSIQVKNVTKISNIPHKQRSIENLMDDEEYDATPGADERG